MFEPFITYITYIKNCQKPSFFNINKGKVKIINSNENFWIKYSEELKNHVSISTNGHHLNIDVKKDGAEIIINASQLHQCSVRLQAGTMDVDHLCAKSNMIVDNGILNAHISRLNPGEINGHVNIGPLNNFSSFQVQNLQPFGGGNDNWMGGFNQYMPPMFHNEIKLSGNNVGCTADLHVGNGILNLD